MGWKGINLRCDQCNHVWPTLVERGLDEDDWRECCPECGGLGRKTMSAPMVLRASYPDGTRRFDPAVKEMAKLKVAQAKAADPKTRKDIDNAIRELRKGTGAK